MPLMVPPDSVVVRPPVDAAIGRRDVAGRCRMITRYREFVHVGGAQQGRSFMKSEVCPRGTGRAPGPEFVGCGRRQQMKSCVPPEVTRDAACRPTALEEKENPAIT